MHIQVIFIYIAHLKTASTADHVLNKQRNWTQGNQQIHTINSQLIRSLRDELKTVKDYTNLI